MILICDTAKIADLKGGGKIIRKRLGNTEKWPSGRRRSPAKGVWGQKLHRGFESLLLRNTLDFLHSRGYARNLLMIEAPVAQLD